MTTPTPPTAPHQPEITGYVEPWIAGPGGQVNVKVSALGDVPIAILCILPLTCYFLQSQRIEC